MMATGPTEKVNWNAARAIAPRLLRLLSPYRATVGLGLSALFLAAGLNLYFPAFLQGALNNTLGLHLPEDIPLLTGVLVLLFLVQAALFAVRHYCFTTVGYRVVRDLRARLFSALLVQDVAYFDSARSGDLLNRLSVDALSVQNAVAINLSVAARYLVQVVGGVAMMFLVSPRLAAILVLLIPVLLLAGKRWGGMLTGLSRRMQEELADAAAAAEEALGSIRTVHLFHGRSAEDARFQKDLQAALATGERRARVAAQFSSGMVFLLHSTLAIILAYGAFLVSQERLSVGDLAAFILYGIIVAVSFGFLINVWDDFLHAVGAAERIFAIVDSPPRVVSPLSPIAMPSIRRGEVTFENVSFAYPTRPDVAVLREISFRIAPNQTVAIVGPSGSGKTTISQLIPRFYDPQQGEIRYAGVPVRGLDLEQLRGEIGLVSQEPHLFSFSIEENIRYGNPDATDEEVRAAARAARVHEFAEALPAGYRTPVGSRGVQLSAGQRQRVAIARALLKDAPFLILDEATSALDSENEYLVQQALQALMAGKTTLVIAHRLSTVQHADLVLVLCDGAISQFGSPEELKEQTGLYRTLIEHQML